jgi:predicted nucleotidyltransferase component of viral defense system
MNRAYLDAVRLLLAVAPVIFRKPTFALKGGTAINLFVRDMPRLSVDLDLVYTDHKAGRDDAMRMISSHLELIRADLNELGISVTHNFSELCVHWRSLSLVEILTRQVRKQRIQSIHANRCMAIAGGKKSLQ